MRIIICLVFGFFLSACVSERSFKVTWGERTVEVHEKGVLLGTWKSSAEMTTDTLKANDARSKANLNRLADIGAGTALGLATGLMIP